MKTTDKLKLYIDTSTNKKTVVRLGDKSMDRDSSTRHSQAVLPLIKKLLGKNKVTDITEIEVKTTGDSFTGLRVGAAVANALNLALNLKSKIITPQYE